MVRIRNKHPPQTVSLNGSIQRVEGKAPTSASISACLFSKSLATAMALCLPDRLQLTAHSHNSVTTASSLGAT